MHLHKTEIRQTLIESGNGRGGVALQSGVGHCAFRWVYFVGSLGVRNSCSNYGMSLDDLRF
jgi:hypothetical protein